MPEPAPTPGRTSHARHIFWVTVISVVLAGLAVWRWWTTGFDWERFTATFAGVNWLWLLASIPVVLVTYAVRALRWAVMVKPLTHHVSFWHILDATCVGFTAIVFFGRAGELVRPYLIANKEKVPFSSQIAAWLLERILDLLMVVLIFGTALAEISHSGIRVGPNLRWVVEAGGAVIGLVGAGCVAFILLFRYLPESTPRRISAALAILPEHYRRRAEDVISAFVRGMGCTRSIGFVIRLLAYSVLEWVAIIGCFFLLFQAFPATANLYITDVVIFAGVVALGSAIQLPGIGGGMQIASIVVLTEFFGRPLEDATGIALMLWAVSFLVIVPVGLFLALREGLNLRRLARMTESSSEGSVLQ